MISSIKYFEENCISELEKREIDFLKNPASIADYVISVTEEMHKLGLIIIRESLEELDRLIQESVVRKKHWYIEAHDNKSLITSLGTVSFQKTLFTNKETGKSVYLLDQLMELEKHERITDDAIASILEESVQTSYRRGGDAASITDSVSKQTVKKKLHNLQFPAETNKPKVKKEVDYLYIEADEDHLSLQFREKKGDLEVNEFGRKNNGLIAKLVYVHEGVEAEKVISEGSDTEKKSKRHKLINPHYFGSTSEDQDNSAFWDDIYNWIDSHYELKKIKKIYLNSDGGGWITGGLKRMADVTQALDEFHLQKYMIRLTSHMKDSTEDARKEIYEAIKEGKKVEFKKICERLKDALPGETGVQRIEEARDYILNNWEAARVRVTREEGIVGSSTEGHVYHAFSSRMSTKPMGWSILGAGKMTKLRVYYLNGGNMLELAKYQHKYQPMAAGMEESFLSAEALLRYERRTHKKNGKYIESITHSISDELKNREFIKGILGSRICDWQ